MKRTPLQRGTSKLSRGKPLSKGTVDLTRGSKLKSRPKSPEEKQQQSEDIAAMWLLFEEHWEKKPHRCENCDVQIYGENKSLYHDHLLEKSKYKELKYEIDNLYLVCADCHTRKTNGSISVRYQKAINNAKKRFNI